MGWAARELQVGWAAGEVGQESLSIEGVRRRLLSAPVGNWRGIRASQCFSPCAFHGAASERRARRQVELLARGGCHVMRHAVQES